MILLPRALALDEGVEGIAPRPPPRREQLVALGEVARIGIAVPVPAGDLAPRADVAPVLPARDEHEQVDLDPLGGPAQHVEVRGREGGHREEGRATGPAGGADAGGKPFPEGVDGRNPVAGRSFPLLRGRPFPRIRPSLPARLPPPERASLRAPPSVFDQAPPQPRLPVRGRAALPFPDPVRAVEQAAVEDPGEAVRELEALARVPVPEVAPHRLPVRPLRQLRQDVVDAPPQLRRGIRLLPGKIRHRLAHDRPGELGRELETEVGRDAEGARELQREPPPDGGMRHDDALGRERLPRLHTHEAGKRARQRLHPVRMMQLHRASRSTLPRLPPPPRDGGPAPHAATRRQQPPGRL